METLQQIAQPATLRIFVSYAREDRPLVDHLRSGLQRLHHEVWVDDRLSVGQAWWSEILAQLRKCDAIVVAVSPALLESKASATERQYACSLGKPLLPVCVRPVRTEFLPSELAPLQMVDYCDPGPDAAFDLAYALAHLPESPPLPDPLPELPPIPLSYFGDLTQRVHADNLTLDEQLALVARLRPALGRKEEHEPALELLRAMQQRDDLYLASAKEIEAAIALVTPTGQDSGAPGDTGAGIGDGTKGSRSRAENGGPHRACAAEDTPDTRGVAVAEPQVPPGWYPDPTSRHGLRWFEGDWTDWACDDRQVVEDPL